MTRPRRSSLAWGLYAAGALMLFDLPLSLACASLLGVAITLQKRGLRPTWRASLRSPLWRFAVGLELLADALYLAAASSPGARLMVVQPIVALHFVIAMGTAMWILRERLGRREAFAAALLVLGGGIVIAGRTEVALEVVDRTLALSLGALVVLLGIATSVLARAETFGAIAAGLVFSGSVVATRVAALAWRADDRLGLVVVGALSLVVLGNIAGFILVQLALRRGRAAIVSPVVALVTLVVPLPIGVLALHERVTTLSLAGCGAVVAGLAVLLGKRAA